MAGVKNRPTATSAFVATGVLGVLIGLVLTVLPAPVAVAATGINKTINFQGKVTNTNGTNVANGTYTFVFSIYTVASGGSNIWTETKSLSVTDGIFQTQLGDTTALPGSVDFNTDNIYLGMAFNSDPEMTPRIQFTASPYAFNSDLLDGLDSSAFAQLSPGSAQSGFLNVTGNVSSGATVAAATSVQAPLLDTASAVALNIGTGTATSVTIGRVTTPFLVQGNSTSTFTAKNGSFTTTVGFTTPTANNSINFPDAGGTVCTTVAATCSATYQAAGSYVAKNAADTSSFAVTSSNYLYGFTNSSSAVASGVLKLDNGTNTGNGLYVTAAGNAGANSALIVADNTLNNSTGNLIDLRSTQSSTNASRFAVDTTGNVTQAGGSSTTQTINGQTISSAANFTGTVTAATSLLAPLVDVASAGTLSVGTSTATALTIGKTSVTTTVAGTTQLGASAGTGALVNNGSTVNTTLAVADDSNGGTLGGTPSGGLTAAQSVDIYTSISVAQTTTGQTITLPTPTASTAYGRVLYLANIGTASFTLLGTTVSPGTTATLVWANKNGGAGWTFAGADGNGILNQNSSDQTADFRISGTGRANTSFTAPLFDAVSGSLNIGTTTATGVSIGGAATTGTIAIGSAAASTLNIGTGAFAHTIAIGTGAAAQAITIGSTNTTSSLSLQGGSTGLTANATSGNLTVSTTTSGTLAVTSAGALNLSGAAASSLNVGTNALTVTSGGASSWANTSGNLSLSTLTSGNISVSSVGTLALTGTNFNLATTGVVTLAGGQTADVTTLAGTAPTALVFQPGNNTSASSTGAGLTLQAGNDSGATASTGGTVTVKGGDASGSGTKTGGAVIIDSGSGATAGGTVTIGGTNAASVAVGRTGVTTTTNGTSQVGASAGNGAFVNNGSTVNSTYAMANLASGGWDAGGASATVDKYTSISANQTTTGQTLTVPAPTANTAYGRLLYLSNIGTASFTLLGTTVSAGSTATLVWANKNGGAGWTFAGADGNGILNQNSADQTADFRISGTGRANTSFTAPLFDTITASQLNLGTGTANAISIGSSSVTTTVNGTLRVGASAGTGLLQNNGATVNTVYNMANLASGGWDAGGAAATVDIYTYIAANQTTASQTLTVPAPTANTTYGRVLYLSNIGTASFTLLGTTVSAGSTATLVWANKNGGAGWTFAGADGNGILNQNAADQTADFRISGTGRANTSLLTPLLDTATGVALALGTTNATAINLNQNTAIAAGKNLTMSSGAGQFSQTFTGTTTSASTITANSLTTGNALRVVSANNTAANTSWSAISFNPTNSQGTTAVSGANLISGLDIQFTQAPTVAGNNETVANFAIAANSGSPTDSTVNSIINVANNDTATGNQITATNGLLIQGSNIANGINLNGTFTSNLITATNFAVTQGGAITGASALLKPAADSFTTPTLQVQTSASNNIFTVASNSADVRVGIGLGGSNLPSVNAGLEILGALRLTGGGGGNADTYTTPVGSSVATKINIPYYDAGNFGQILSMGLPATNCTGGNSTSCTARVMSLFDARTLAHQPTISVFNPGETDVLGFSWDGSATVGLVKNTASTIGLMANNLSVAQFANSSGNAVITTGTNATLTASASNKLDITANAASTWSTSAGNLTVDSAASLNLGTSAATGVSIGKNGTTTTSAGNVTVGTAGSTTLLKNNGATQNVVCAYTGVTGATTLNTAGKTVDGCTSFTIVTTGAAALTVPAPAAGAGSIVYISVLSTSTNAPTLLGVSLGIGSTATLVYNGSAWTYAGADANSLQTAYNNSTDPEIVLGTASTAGLSVRDNATPISGNLFEVTNNGGTTSYLSVTSAAANVGGNLTFTKEAAHTIQITDSTTAAAAGGALTVKAAAGYTSGAGGALALAGGAGGNAGAGGAASLTGGASGGGATAGGAVTIQGGASNATAGSAGGGVSIQGAAGSTTGTGAVGGTIALQAGNSGGTGNNTGGAITLQGGTASSNASAVGGAITLTAGAGSTTAGSTGGTTTINGGAAGAVAGGLAGGVAINGGAGSSTGTGSAGAPVNIKGGNAGGSGANNGGAVTFTGGNASGTGTGGGVTIQGGAAAAVAGSVGGGVAIQGANGSSTGTGAAGGSITLTAGNGQGSGNNNGGSIQFTAGTATGSGVPGVISIDTPVFTATTETASGASYALTQSNVDGFSTIVVTENTANAIVTVPAPRNTTTGRILYITAAGSNSFTLTPSGGPSVNMSPGNTTMLVWNNAVSQWTASASGGSLQQAYNNTTTTPAAIVTTSASKNILFQAGSGYDNSALLQVSNSVGANMISVDTTNTATGLNLMPNSGAETATGFTTTYPAAGFGTTGSSEAQNTTAGNFAAGTASVSVTATAANSGIRANLGAALATSTVYNVSFSVKSGSSWTNDIDVRYNRTGTTSDGAAATCSTSGASSSSTLSTRTVPTTAFTKISCYITTSGTAGDTTANIVIFQTASATRTFYVDNIAVIAQNSTGTQDVGDLMVGGAGGQGLTLFTLDSYASTPWTGTGNTTLFGSMYYDTTAGLIKCYQASGWGTCGAAPNNNVIMVPEYGSAVLNAGTGGDSHIGTMTANMCSGSSRLSIQPTEGTVCAATEEYNYYRWTSGQTTAQTYSIFAKYQLPPTFNNFYDNNTINLVGRVSSTTDASVSYSLYGNTGTLCGSLTNVASAGANTWYTTTLTGNETGCGMQPSDIITFKIDMSSKNNAYAYVSNVMFTMTGK